MSSTAFGPRGTQSILAKITIGATASFMLLALALSLPAVTGQRSVLQDVDEEATPATPTPEASPGASPAASPAAQEGANSGAATTPAAPADVTASPASNTNPAASPAPSK